MDARIVKTKQKIKDSLMFLLHSKRISDVTISELCKKANINRNTFYTHYSTPEAVLADIANELSANLFSALVICNDRSQISQEACKHVKDNLDAYKILMANDGEKVYLKPAVEYSKKFNPYRIDNTDGKLSPQQVEIIQEYSVLGTIGIIKNWIASDIPISPELMGKTIDLVSKGLIEGVNSTK